MNDIYYHKPIRPEQDIRLRWICLLVIFGIVLALKGRLKPDGSLFLAYFGLYSAWRFGSDFLRDGTPFLFGLHQAQVIGIIVLAVAIFLLSYRTRWVRD